MWPDARAPTSRVAAEPWCVPATHRVRRAPARTPPDCTADDRTNRCPRAPILRDLRTMLGPLLGHRHPGRAVGRTTSGRPPMSLMQRVERAQRAQQAEQEGSEPPPPNALVPVAPPV